MGSNQDRECGSGPTEYGDSLHHGPRMVSTWLLNDLFQYQLGNMSQNQTEYNDLKLFLVLSIIILWHNLLLICLFDLYSILNGKHT